MKKFLFIVIFSCLSISSYAQYRNLWQPDSVYAHQKVKKLFIYDNSFKDLIFEVEFDRFGNRIKKNSYSPSFDKASRQRKHISNNNTFQYNSHNMCIKRVDSTFYEGAYFSGMLTYQYDSINRLVSTKYYSKEAKLQGISKYSYEPFKSTSIRIADSIVWSKTKYEFDAEFYVKSESEWTYCDYFMKASYYNSKFVKCESKVEIDNVFNSKNQLVKSYIKSNHYNRNHELLQEYTYYKNGLLKKINGSTDTDYGNFRGYTPWLYKYEFWE